MYQQYFLSFIFVVVALSYISFYNKYLQFLHCASSKNLLPYESVKYVCIFQSSPWCVREDDSAVSEILFQYPIVFTCHFSSNVNNSISKEYQFLGFCSQCSFSSCSKYKTRARSLLDSSSVVASLYLIYKGSQTFIFFRLCLGFAMSWWKL